MKSFMNCNAVRFSQPVHIYRGEDSVYKFIEKKMLEESKNCKEIIKNHFKEELVINKENERQIELILFWKRY